jgi:RNA polymerase sigma-70 factor, ECF subfamily
VLEGIEAKERETGAPSDFESFFRDEYARLVRALYLLTGSKAEAEDVAQEAMARVYERWGRIQRMASPTGYVYRVAMNLQRRRVRLLARRGSVGTPTPEDPTGAADTRSDVMRAMRELSPAHREVLVVVTWLGMGTPEAARVLGIKDSSVRARLSRARAALKEQLGENYG